MRETGWRVHLPLLRILLGLGVLLIALVWPLSSFSNRETPPLNTGGWSWAPALSGANAPALASDAWSSFGDSGSVPASEPYWLRIPLPESDAREPQLWIFGAYGLKVYVDNELLYAYSPERSGHRLNPFFHWNLVPLPEPVPEEVLLFLDNGKLSGTMPSVRLLDKHEMVTEIFSEGAVSITIGALQLFCAIIAFGLYRSRRDRLYFYFFLLAACGAYGSFARNRFLQYLWDQPWIGYLEKAVFPLGVFAFIGTFCVLFHPIHSRLLNRLRRTTFGFFVATLAAALADEAIYAWIINYLVLPAFLIVAAQLFYALGSIYRRRRDIESVWMLSGSFVVTFVALVHVIRYYSPELAAEIVRIVPAASKLPGDLMSFSLLLFLLCLVRVIAHRFDEVNRELSEFNRTLEHKVRERTAAILERNAQLQKTNEKLAASMRENAETMAEALVLEERNRIVGVIHGRVAHVLSASIDQMEQAEQAVDDNAELAESRLEKTQQTVRQGLEAIRKSVRLLKDDAPPPNSEWSRSQTGGTEK
ncbi:7TM diverse intracellular signaling domain-containing protein [Cohnella algarum]|uniref:7TM diverse intracellular signaling domain-containing protein n=1 Tax=Cohnella algarum TaxID=2044859 RepID=UPI001966DF75|nr:hypothetical protein [Cohnella algarum]